MRIYLFFLCVTIRSIICGPVTGLYAGETRMPWSFQIPLRPAIPETHQLPHGDRVRNEIDAFVLTQLAKQGLEPAPLADKQTLVRRAYFDLLGLPPTPEQAAEFVNNSSPQAWPQLIDHLLESKHYGERWGRHWLDVVRYADSAGYEGDDSYPLAWRYRDYVVRSFNQDKPFNIFLQEQIAGDELWPDNLDLDPKRVYVIAEDKLRHLEARIGTGFYAFSPRISQSGLDARRLHHELLTDWVDTTASVFMGLTMGCARCHQHKFDPLTQEDYYAMQAVFTSSVEVEVPTVSPMEVQGWHHYYPFILAVHEARVAYEAFKKRTGKRELTQAEAQQSERLRSAIVNAVMNLPATGAAPPGTAHDPLMQIPKVRVLGHERSELIKPVHFLERGELERQLHVMKPGLPASLAEVTGRSPKVKGPFGSRKELALWLSNPEHPLTARVMINRIWHWHFGRGIVATPNDFGNNGSSPTHPSLLDWLSREFVESGWRVKQMHRLIMNSSTYQMTSRFATDKHLTRDPQNHFLWRMNRRRLEAEALWDAVHSTAGTINLKMGGRPVVPPLAEDEMAALRHKFQWPVSGDSAEFTRRGLYILVLRNFRFPMFEVFDAPVSSLSCPQREVTTVATQALWSLNSPSVFRQAKQLASRVVRDAGTDPACWPPRLWSIALSRSITDKERLEAGNLLDALMRAESVNQETPATEPVLQDLPEPLSSLPPNQAAGLIKLCLAVYNLNEFAFVD